MALYTLYPTYRRCFFLFCLLFFAHHPFRAEAQNPPTEALPEATYEALADYVHFSNEIMHALHLMRSDFESINWQLLEYGEQLKDAPFYEYEELFSNADYFPISLDSLFQALFVKSTALPASVRGRPFQLMGNMYQIANELRSMLRSFDAYFNSEGYQRDQGLEAAFRRLKRAEILYGDIAILREKLSWSIAEIRGNYAFDDSYIYVPILLRMRDCLAGLEPLLKSISNDKKISNAALVAAQQCFRDLEAGSESLLEGIPEMEELFSPRKLLPRFLGSSDELMEVLGSPPQSPAAPSQRLKAKQPSRLYYQYNRQALPLYNRYGEGLTVLYNDLLRFSNSKEVLPIFEVAASFKVWEGFPPTEEQPNADSAQQAPEPAFTANHLVLLLDVSFSMESPEKMPLLKSALKELLQVLGTEDKMSLIAYSGTAEILLPPTSVGTHRDSIQRVIQRLEPRHSSDADAGLELAYELASDEKHYLPNGNNRIILATDGNLVLKHRNERLIEKSTEDDIRLSVFYFNEKEVFQIKQTLSALAELGKGNYTHVRPDNAKEALLVEAQRRAGPE